MQLQRIKSKKARTKKKKGQGFTCVCMQISAKKRTTISKTVTIIRTYYYVFLCA